MKRFALILSCPAAFAAESLRVRLVTGGHDRHAHLNPNWQRVARNAIVWAGGK